MKIAKLWELWLDQKMQREKFTIGWRNVDTNVRSLHLQKVISNSIVKPTEKNVRSNIRKHHFCDISSRLASIWMVLGFSHIYSTRSFTLSSTILSESPNSRRYTGPNVGGLIDYSTLTVLWLGLASSAPALPQACGLKDQCGRYQRRGKQRPNCAPKHVHSSANGPHEKPSENS